MAAPKFHRLKIKSIRPETDDAVALRFDIPADLPGATLGRSGGTGYTWELKAEAEAPGVDFVARFELPVIETPKAL